MARAVVPKEGLGSGSRLVAAVTVATAAVAVVFAVGSSTINSLLTEHEGRTGKYWPEVVAVRTERSDVHTATTEGHYSPVRPEEARLVSCLLYGTL